MNQLDLGYWLAALESEDPLESWDPGELGLALSRQEYPDLDCAYYLSWLDRLAQEVLGNLADRESLSDRQQALAKVLFLDLGLRGNKESYYESQNSFVNDVLERGRGIPISIALIWAAVGYRLSWPIHGLSFPGHVMIGLGNLMGKSNHRDYLVLDPFHPDDMEKAQFTYEAFDRRVERLKSVYELLVKGPREEKIKAAEAQVAGIEADLTKAMWRLENCRVRAPVTGIILTKKAEEGNMVNPAAFNVSANLCEMADLTQLEVDLSIQERDFARLGPRMECYILPEAYRNSKPFLAKYPKGYTGYISRVMPQADRGKGAIPVRVKIDVPANEQGTFLKPDMKVEVTFFDRIRPIITPETTPAPGGNLQTNPPRTAAPNRTAPNQNPTDKSSASNPQGS